MDTRCLMIQKEKNEIRLGTKDSMCSSELGFDLSVSYSVQLTWF